ncbi:glycoside hydrolase family 19 protein [Myxosarcina sp. GI1(2024)]
MLRIKALQDTLLKKLPEQSRGLDKSQLSPVEAGRELSVNVLQELGSHTRVEISHGAGSWWIFTPHWDLNDTFPSGLPRPDISEKPSKNEVIESIVRYCISVGITNRKHIAYVLSTAENESNFKAIRELRGRTLTRDQQKYWHTGFMGRGFIQVTWRSNYQRVGKKLGIDLVSNPDLLLTYPVAIASLVLGMRDGWYTGKKLSDYKPGDYWNQRAIVNPGEIRYRSYWHRAQKFVDSAEEWEGYLNKFASIFPGLA